MREKCEKIVKISIRTKFIASVTLLIILIMVSVAASVYYREKNIIIDNTRNMGITLVKTLSNTVKNFILLNDFPEIDKIIKELKESETDLPPENRVISDIHIFSRDTGNCISHIDENGNSPDRGKPLSYFTSDVDVAAINSQGILALNFRREDGKNFINVSYPILEGNQFYGVARIRYSLAPMQRELAQTFTTIIWMAAGAILLGFLVSILLSQLILRELFKVLDGTAAVSVGDFSKRIEVSSNDEFRLLAETFNRMTFNISLLYNVSQAMNFISDTGELLNLIMDKTLEALGAERGSLMLTDETEEYLICKVVRGLKEDAGNFIKLPIGDGVAGYVAATAEPLIVNEGSQSQQFKSFRRDANDDREKKVQSILCVPLKVDDKVIGVLNIVNKKSGSNFNEQDKKLASVLASQAAVTLNKARLYEDSITDGMTQLFIHRYFQLKLDDEIKRAQRYSQKMALVMFDIDHFKNFNDTYGHQQGDIVIKGVAAIIKQTVRDNIDIACRYGGEEFTVICPETDLDGAYVFAERLRKKIASHPFPGQEEPLFVAISLGIAEFPTHAQTKLELIKKADEALYASKLNGRNTTTIYSEDIPKLDEDEQEH